MCKVCASNLEFGQVRLTDRSESNDSDADDEDEDVFSFEDDADNFEDVRAKRIL